MKQMLSKTCYVLGVGAIIAALIAGFLAYMIVGFDPATQEYTDGLGRPLGPSPFFMRFVFDEDKLWAGWGWWAIDMLVFLGVISVAMKFFGLGKKVKGKGPVQEAPEDLDATGVANEILRRHGLPVVGARVTVTLPDGETAAGEVTDGFTERNVELGLEEDGITIALDGGGTFEEFVTDFGDRGIVIAPEQRADAEVLFGSPGHPPKTDSS